MSATPAPRNHWVRRVIVGWALFLGGLGAAGWYETSATSAFVSLFACVMMLNASHQLRMAEGRRWSKRIWTAALVLFGVWSGYSAHHAVADARGVAGLEGAFLLTFFTLSALIDPFLMWAVVDTERGPATVRPSAADYQPFPADLVGHSATVVDFPAGIGRSSATLAAAVAGVAGLSAGGSTMAAELQPPAIHEPPGRVIDASPTAHAERLLHSGVSQRMAAERTKLSRYQISQIAKAMKNEAVA